MVQNIKKIKKISSFWNPWKPDPPCLSGFPPHGLVMGGISCASGTMQKSFWFWLGPICLFCLYSLTVGNRSKDRLLGFMSEIFPLVFPSKSFIVSSATFRSLIHFRYFVCLMVLKNVLISFFLHVAVQFSQHHLLKRLFFWSQIFHVVLGCVFCFLGHFN